jgi:ribose transport system ATP-binding protein
MDRVAGAVPTGPDSAAAVAVEAVSKAFPGTLALDRVSLAVQPGEVHAVVGENGAGKSTLLLVLAGVHPPDAGRILVAGREVTFAGPREAQQAGIGTVFQELSLVDGRSVTENVMVAGAPTRAGLLDRRGMVAATRSVLAQLGCELRPDRPVGTLDPGDRQMVEIAKALALDARVLLLDEPTATLSRQETRTLLGVLARLRRRRIAVVFVSHRLAEVFEVADRITILRDGRLVGTFPRRAIDPDAAVRAMVGRVLDETYPPRPAPAALDPQVPPRLELRGLRCGPVGPVDLRVAAGEVVGLAGLKGAGRSRLLRAVFGAEAADAGAVLVDGRPVRLGTPWRSLRQHLAFVPADRRRDGVFPRRSLADNLVVSALPALCAGGILRPRRLSSLAARLVGDFGITARGTGQPIAELSGGNQQKAMLARALAAAPRTLLVDEPSQGIDVGARAAVHRLLRRCADGGMAILMISSDLPELLGVCDRVAVMARGTLRGVLDAREATEERVLALAVAPGNQDQDGPHA